jgi:alkanesulfonate monooxygenase SsuD/methylene tetrahydromethanopterin reductase-like flavin-dependent oxidoreductase (luciferase family)
VFSMRFGFRLAPSSPATRQELIQAALAMTEWGEANGALAVMFHEHHDTSDGYLSSPLIVAAAAAARTSTVPINVGALLLLMYDPIKLAEDMIVLDHLSGGRVSYTIGLGYRDSEYAMFNIERRRRGAIMDERIEVLKRALSGERFEWEGRTIHVTPEPLTPGGPILAYGGGSPGGARRAARFGMMLFSDSRDDSIPGIYDAEAERVGNPTGMVMIPPAGSPTSVFVANDVDDGWEQMGPYLLHDVLMYGAWMGEDTSAASWSGAQTVDELRAENGTYQIVTPARARELVAEFGTLGLQPLCGGMPPELAWESLKLIETDVLPAAGS